ncbi:hypothetical protein BGX23_012100 [Mortierella sp. AD031]|nr:hypothetical protein BGX23_012100 [Mortierella sp. AD031]
MIGGKVLVHPQHPLHLQCLDWNKEGKEGLGLEQQHLELEPDLDRSRESLKSDDLLDKDPVVDHLALALNTNNNIGDNSNQNISVITPLHGNGNINSTPATASTSTRKSYSLARARAPSPPCVVTGFCSISKTPIKSSGEPSPQDFLGEADLPYPLPSTLHDRQTRQRKRAEQLRQLKIREECEARENNNTNNRRKGIRRRGASFSAGMMYSPATSLGLSSPSSSSTNSNSTPSSPALFSDSPRMQSTSSFRSSAWHHHRLSLNQHLQRSPSSPIRGSSSVNNLHLPNRYSTSNIGQLTKDKAIGSLSAPAPAPALPPPRRRVVFDLENIQVFEYDVSGDDWSPSSGPSSPTLPPASTNGRDSYVRYCPPSDCSSSGSSDEETTSPRMPVRNIKSKAVSS